MRAQRRDHCRCGRGTVATEREEEGNVSCRFDRCVSPRVCRSHRTPRQDPDLHLHDLFAEERFNVSENRPVLHVALRMPKGATVIVRTRGKATSAGRPATSSTSPSADATTDRYGLRGAVPIHRVQPDVPVCLQRGLDGLRGSHQGPIRRRNVQPVARRRGLTIGTDVRGTDATQLAVEEGLPTTTIDCVI